MGNEFTRADRRLAPPQRAAYEHQEQHQELRVAEVVFEHPGGKHGDDGGDGRGGEHAVATALEQGTQAQ